MHPIRARGQLLITRHRNHAVEDPRVIARGIRTGELTKAGNGAYVRTEVWRGLDQEQQERLRVAASIDAGREGLVVSHRSAGALWGVPSIRRRPGLVDVRTTIAAGTRSEHGFHKHAVRDLDQHVVETQGFLVTSLPRTIVDLALSEPFTEAVVAIDWALRSQVDRVGLLRTLDEVAPKQGRAEAERAILFGDGASGSPGESRSRAHMELANLVMPVLQQSFFDQDGFIGQVDFYWPQFDLIGEFDGAIRYSDAAMLDGRQPAQAVIAEKRREDRLRAVGPRVTRWMWDVLDERGRLASRLMAAGVRRR